MSVLLPFLVFALAAFAQSASGFGFALVAVPLMALAVDPRSAVVAAALVCLAQTATTAVAEREHVRWTPALRLLVAAAVGMPVGLLVLRLASPHTLTITIALVTLVCTVVVWRGVKLSPTPTAVASAGVLCGVLSTATGTTGPPLVAAFQAMGFAPREFKATLAAVFTGTALVSIGGFALTGVLTSTALTAAAAGLPAAALGGWAGTRLTSRVAPEAFRRVVLAALVVGSGAALANAVAA